MTVDLPHIGCDRVEYYLDKQLSTSRYSLKLVYLWLLSGQLRLEIGTHPHKFFDLLPLLNIFVATVLTLAFHYPFG